MPGRPLLSIHIHILAIVVAAVLLLAVAGGPLLAIRNPAEADKLTPGCGAGR